MALTRERTPVRQHQIIEAVRKLITTKGMDSVTIDAIAEEVGLTEGAIYRHFTSKLQILFLLIEDIEQSLLATVRDAQRGGAPAPEELESILKAHLGYTEDRRAVSFIVIAEAMGFEGAALKKRVSRLLSSYLEAIHRVLEQGVAEGTIRQDISVEAAALAFLGLIQSTVTLWALSDYQLPLAERCLQLWEIYKRGITATP